MPILRLGTSSQSLHRLNELAGEWVSIIAQSIIESFKQIDLTLAGSLSKLTLQVGWGTSFVNAFLVGFVGGLLHRLRFVLFQDLAFAFPRAWPSANRSTVPARRFGWDPNAPPARVLLQRAPVLAVHQRMLESRRNQVRWWLTWAGKLSGIVALIRVNDTAERMFIGHCCLLPLKNLTKKCGKKNSVLNLVSDGRIAL